MSYWPLLSFGPSATVPARPIRCLRLSALECLASLADDMTYYALCRLLLCGQTASGALSRRSDTGQISWGKLSRLPRTVAESTLRTV